MQLGTGPHAAGLERPLMPKRAILIDPHNQTVNEVMERRYDLDTLQRLVGGPRGRR
jgi:hypothetical protein